jgi:hypothetical protein
MESFKLGHPAAVDFKGRIVTSTTTARKGPLLGWKVKKKESIRRKKKFL